MRSKAPLMLMEQMVMLLVFALAAALCLRAFVKADEISKQSEVRDHAVMLCQNVAETIKDSAETNNQLVLSAVASRLDADARDADTGFTLLYNAAWTRAETSAETAYSLDVVRLNSEVPGLGTARVTVTDSENGAEPLFSVDVSWQEVSAYA